MSATAEADARAAIDDERKRIEEMEGDSGRKSIEDMHAAGEGADDDPEQLSLLEIGGSKIDTSVGGSKPDESEVKIKSISRPITGQLKRHETRTLLVTVRVSEVGFIDKYDDDGRPTSSKRRATCTPVSVVPVTAEQADRILEV